MNNLSDMQIINVPLTSLIYGENVRQTYDDTEMSELMVSMRKMGLLQPVGVCKTPEADQFRMVFGFRRSLAAKKLGWETIDAVLIEAKNEEDFLIKNLTENVIRADVSMPEQGRVFQLLQKRGLTKNEIAARVGCPLHRVNLAINAYIKIPAKHRGEVTHGILGKSDKPGSMSVSNALKVGSIQKQHQLTNKQADDLYQFAKEDGSGTRQMGVIAALIAKDVPVKEAIELAKKTRIVTVTMSMDEEHLLRLEKKYKLDVHDIIYTWLEKNEELQIYPMRKKHQDKVVSVTRKAGV
jgi:ParB/RepB/Spo0J family partition protein